jgi:hypothetical protein
MFIFIRFPFSKTNLLKWGCCALRAQNIGLGTSLGIAKIIKLKPVRTLTSEPNNGSLKPSHPKIRFREKTSSPVIISKPHPQSEAERSEFLVIFHQGVRDTLGTPFNSYSRFATLQQAAAERAVQMAERSVEQRLAGVFFSTRKL